MNRASHHFSRLAATLLALAWLMGLFNLGAQPAEVVVESADITKSPVQSFRELLVMPADIRQKLLAKRSEQIRQRISDKIREYTALSAEEREARLQATELSWYLTQLLNTPPTNRAAQLALIPLPMRALVESRLRVWDTLRTAVKQHVRPNQAISYLARRETAPAPPPASVEEARQKLKTGLDRLVKLRSEEKIKVLRVLPEAERLQMERTLQVFEQLPPDQRERCLQSFTKFAILTPADQQTFLKSAQLWTQMSATERQSWRELVERVSFSPDSTPTALVPTHGG